jgi:hypothetical protein
MGLEEASDGIVIEFVVAIAIGRIVPVALLHVGDDSSLIPHHGREAQVLAQEQMKDFSANFGAVVLGVEGKCSFALLRLHRGDVFEVGVGQESSAQLFQIVCQGIGILGLKQAEDKVLGTAIPPDDYAPAFVKKDQIAGFVYIVVTDTLLGHIFVLAGSRAC